MIIMKIQQVNTKRGFYQVSCYQIVKDWEDVFAKLSYVPLYYEKGIVYNRYVKRLWHLSRWMQTGKTSFTFDMWPLYERGANNKANIIPCIIDGYFSPSQIPRLIRYYKHNKLVLFSNMENIALLDKYKVYEKINYKHLALSLPDKYMITKDTRFDKRYDLVVTGRKDGVFAGFLERYVKNHSDFKYLIADKSTNFKLMDSDGTVIGDLATRDKYIEIMKQSRCALYATPINSLNKKDPDFKGFHQVTPRLLEFMACGCNVIARYDDNPDTRWYQLDKMFPNINTYEEFEAALDRGRTTEPDMEKYSNYLEQHYTSKRVEQLKKYLEEL